MYRNPIPVPSLLALCLLAILVSACEPAAEVAPIEEPTPAAAIAQPEPATDYSDLLPNAVEPEPGIVAGGQPSLEQLDQARDLGFKTVINMRTDGESEIGRTASEERGLTYVALPIAGAADFTAEKAAAFAEALAAAERPVIVHCGSGNRVGALFALKAFHLDGADADAAVALGLEAGLTRLEPMVREHLATQSP